MSVAAKRLTWDDIKDWPEDAGRTEIVDGELVMSPTTATRHQEICTYLGAEILLFVRQHSLGLFLSSPMHVILATHLHYEPDLCFITNQRRHIVKEKFIDGPPDLIIEVISESNRTHDTVVKFRNYAQHGVTEYWLVDPRDNEISTWRLEGDGYVLLGRARPADRVVTDVLSGLELDPGSVLPIQSPERK